MDYCLTLEADGRSGGQEIPRLLWNGKAHYRVHKNPQLSPVLSHLNSVHNPISYLRSILILSSHLPLSQAISSFQVFRPDVISHMHAAWPHISINQPQIHLLQYCHILIQEL
jgi:hypothetical protein